MTRKLVLFLLSIGFAGTISAQLPEDALRYSWYGSNGTARNQAIGGVMGSLGGDITATFVNPAGLGLYKTGEFVLSPGFNFLKNKASYRDSDAANKKSGFNLGTSGLVFGFGDNNNKWKSKAFSLAITRTADFNSNIFYKGENNYSSYSEQFASEVANANIDINDASDANVPSSLSLGSRMAAYTYLIDTATINGQKQVVGLPEFVSNRLQQDSITSRGGITEMALGLAGNMNDKFYIGGSLGLAFVNYERHSVYRESDLSGNNNNNFAYSVFDETNSTKGAGINAKLGIIFKPTQNVRVGIALHSPNFYNLKDSYHSTMSTNTEKYVPNYPVITVNSDLYTGTPRAVYQYNFISPWKALISGSYVLREIEDVTQQKGFISADLEYVNYKASSYQVSDPNASDNSYYAGVNKGIDQIYKGNINAKIGGELKFNTLMVRAGASYFGSPYKDKELKASRSYVSAGLGYRDKGLFLDLAYVYAVNKDVNFPYRLSDKGNVFANIKGLGSNIKLTMGMKF